MDAVCGKKGAETFWSKQVWNIDPARKERHCIPPISAKTRKKTGYDSSILLPDQ
jgi:hypothetical protein